MYENCLFISMLLQWKETNWFWTAVYCSGKQLSWVLHALQEDDNGEVVPASPMAAGEGRKGHGTKGQRLVHILMQTCEPIIIV